MLSKISLVVLSVLASSSQAFAYPPRLWQRQPVEQMLAAVANQNLGALCSVIFRDAHTRYCSEGGLRELSAFVAGRDLVASSVSYDGDVPGRDANYSAVAVRVVERGNEAAGVVMTVRDECWRQGRGGRHCRIYDLTLGH